MRGGVLWMESMISLVAASYTFVVATSAFICCSNVDKRANVANKAKGNQTAGSGFQKNVTDPGESIANNEALKRLLKNKAMVNKTGSAEKKSNELLRRKKTQSAHENAQQPGGTETTGFDDDGVYEDVVVRDGCPPSVTLPMLPVVR
ncbi:hypothetical protein DICVIV_01634 [Dictyocaulus viviparus]|uniref:Uncharacterized protein n=1 Tax=Dictyocaulus viviparus TaxID=29172 RepID=A0A0D8Y866_DICVI|nr:hypothetical protein DICVIV_01634 [Dictyocaulus viviparus]